MKIAEHIYYRKGSCCTYLVDGNLIDPGLLDYGGVMKLLLEAAILRLRRIILTHSHRDHAALAAAIKRITGARVYAHKKTASGLMQQAISIDLDGVVDQYLEEDDVLPILGGARVLYTPGHASDHISLYLEKEKILFSGDALQVRDGKLCMARDALNYDAQAAKESFERLMSLDYRILCPGHREPKIFNP